MSKTLWTSTEAAIATGGDAVGEWSVTGLSIDTRSLEAGDLFVPLKDLRDGHDFIPTAYEKGAGAVISENPIQDKPALIVPDAQKAMEDLAIAARRRSKATRIAITGSVGKTSVKETVATILSAQGQTHKSQKSFNNHWGVPLTLATMPQRTQYGVFEVGMNHAGELSALSPIIAPDIAVITKIAPAHLAHFDGLDAIAKAKAEIFDGLVIGGTAIVNADDDYYDMLSQAALSKGARVISFGVSKTADVRLDKVSLLQSSVSADMHISGHKHALHLPLTGGHWLMNGACAVAIAMAAGADIEKALQTLTTLKPLAGRGDTFQVTLDGKTITIMDESYNANPESMRASIAALDRFASGRKLAILGDMFELGKDELPLHAALSDPLEAAGVSRVIVTGECMRALKGALPRSMRGAWVRDWSAALEALLADSQDDDTVLIKGSNATGLGQLVAHIKQIGTV